jgi:hypothetical protein
MVAPFSPPGAEDKPLYNADMPRRLRQWLPVGVALLAFLARLIPGPRVIDDAYITFRYAQNLLAGYGLVYNPGVAVLGTTTPLYSLLLALAALPFGGTEANFPWLALVLNAVCDAIACWLLVQLGLRLGSPAAGYGTALVWAIAPMSVTFAIGGMETSLTILLVLAAFYLYLVSRPTGAALAGSLALLARPDAALFVAPLALDHLLASLSLLRQRRLDAGRLARQATAFVLPLAIWTVGATLAYGSPITRSIGAKVDAYLLAPDAALIRLLQHYATPFLGHKTFGLWWIAVGLALFPILFGLGALFAIRRNPRSWPLFVSPWLYFAAFSLANPLIFRWYLAPPLPFYFLGILLGGHRVASDLRRPGSAWLLAAAALALTLRGWWLHPDHGPDRPAPDMAYIELELLYERVGAELAGEIGPGETLGAADIGALGYTTGAVIIDTLGLVSPAAGAYYPADRNLYAINYAIPPELVSDLEPDHLVILEVYGRNGLLLDPSFVRSYQLVQTIPTNIYGSRGMLIFQRKATP